jgi:hypothetical protein
LTPQHQPFHRFASPSTPTTPFLCPVSDLWGERSLKINQFRDRETTVDAPC